jgi:hypothetical protein
MLNLKNAALAGLAFLASLAAVPATANDLHFNFGHRDARFGVYLGDNSHTYYPRDRWRERGQRCSPNRALGKAGRMGIRRARIDYVSARRIGVVGRSRGDRIYVTFARSRGCPIIG